MKLLKRLLAGLMAWAILFSPLSASVARADNGPFDNVKVEKVTFKDHVIYFNFDEDTVSCENNPVI